MFMDGWVDGRTDKVFMSFNTEKNLQPHQGEIRKVKSAFYSSKKKNLIIINLFQPVDCKAKSYKFLDKNTKKKKKMSLSQRWSDKSQLDGEKSALLLVEVVELWPVYKYINMFKGENEINSSL